MDNAVAVAFVCEPAEVLHKKLNGETPPETKTVAVPPFEQLLTVWLEMDVVNPVAG